MAMLRRVQRHGVVTLPKELRKRSGLREGDVVRIAYENGKIVITAYRAETYPFSEQEPEPMGQLIDLRQRRAPRPAHLATPLTREQAERRAA